MSKILTNNSPVAGSIAWRAFNLTIEADVYSFPAGSTNKKLVWWIYGATTLTVGDVLPADLTEFDALLFANRNGTAINAMTATALNGDLIVPGTVVAEHLAADTVKAHHIDADAVTSRALQSDLILSEHISAGAVTANSLSVGSVGDNLITNGSFEDITNGSPEGWVTTAMTGGTILPVSGVSSSGALSIEFNATSTSANLRLSQDTSKMIPVSAVAGRRWHVSVRVGANVATTKGFYLRAAWFDANRVALTTGGTSDIAANKALSTTFDVVEGQVTPPSTAKYMRVEVFLISPNVLTKMYVDEVAAREVIMAAVIGDGQIQTPHIKAGTITATSAIIADAAISAAQIGSVNADTINAGYMDGKFIKAGTVAANVIAISDFTDYVPDPSFNEGIMSLPPTALRYASNAPEVPAGAPEGFAVKLPATYDMYASASTGGGFSVKGGDKFYVEAWVRQDGTGTSTLALRVWTSSTNKVIGTGEAWAYPAVNISPSTVGSNGVAPKDGWALVSGVVTIPKTATSSGVTKDQRFGWAALGTGGPTGTGWWIGRWSVRRMNGGELIVDGAIKAGSAIIEDMAITSAKIISLDGGKITAKSITGTQISSKSISVDHLLVGSTDNVIPDAQFTNKNGEWTAGTSSIYSYPANEGMDGQSTFKIATPTAVQAGQYSADISVNEGETFRFSVWVKSTVAIPESTSSANTWVALYVNRAALGSTTFGSAVEITRHNRLVAGVPTETVGHPAIAANTWGLLSGTFTVPAGIGKIRVGMFQQTRMTASAIVRFSDASGYRMGDGNLIVDGAITAKKIGVGELDADKGVIGVLDAGKITFGKMDGKYIEANTIAANKLLVTGANLLPDPNFISTTSLAAINAASGVVGITANAAGDMVANNPTTARNYVRPYGVEQNAGTFKEWIPVVPGEEYLFSAKITYAGTGDVRMTFRIADGSAVVDPPIYPEESPGAWPEFVSGVRKDTIIKVPAGAYWALPEIRLQGVAGDAIIEKGSLSLRKKNDGELIVDGAILAGHIHTDAVEAKHIKANAIEADKIKAGSIDVSKLTIGSADNLVADPQFMDTALTAFRCSTSDAVVNGGWYKVSTYIRSRTGLSAGSYTFRMRNSITGDLYEDMAVVPGRTYRIRYEFFRTSGATGSTRAAVYTKTTTGTTAFIGDGTSAEPLVSGWKYYEREYTIPADVYVMGLAVQLLTYTGDSAQYVAFRNVSMTPMTSGELIVNGAIDGKTITGSTIQTDKADYIGLKMDNSGLRVYEEVLEGVANADTAVSTEFRPDGLTKIGIYGTVDGEKQYLAGMSEEGDVTSQGLNAAGTAVFDGTVIMGGQALHDNAYGLNTPGDLGPVILGRSLIGTATQGYFDSHPSTTDQLSWMDGLPFGLVARGYRNMAGVSVTNQEAEILELGYQGTSWRAYRITVLPWSMYVNGGNTYARLKIYRTLGTTRPTMNDANLLLVKTVRNENSNSIMTDMGGVFYDLSPTGGEVRYLFSFEAIGGTAALFGSATLGGAFRVLVEDMGLLTPEAGSDRTAVRSNGASTPVPKPTDPPPIPPAPKQYTTTFNYSWHKNFNEDGSTYVSGPMAGKAAFGRSPYYTPGGSKRSHIGFSGNISGTLSGATIKKVEVYVYTAHWHYSGGGTLEIGHHNNSSAPSTSAVTSSNVVRWSAKTQSMKKPEGRWITISQDLAMWKAGTVKGIILKAPSNSTSATYYGYATPNKTKLRITYTK